MHVRKMLFEIWAPHLDQPFVRVLGAAGEWCDASGDAVASEATTATMEARRNSANGAKIVADIATASIENDDRRWTVPPRLRH